MYRMDISKKQAILTLIKEDIAKQWLLPCSIWLDNLGCVFFISGAPFKTFDEFKSLVYDLYAKYEMKIELVDLDTHRFIGSAEHAKALFEAFGGRYWHDQIFGSKSSTDHTSPHGWISADFWQSGIYDRNTDIVEVVKNASPLSMEDVTTALF